MLIEWSSTQHPDTPFEAWRCDIMNKPLPWAIGREPESEFHASHRCSVINGLIVGGFSASYATGKRTHKEIRASEVSYYCCAAIRTGIYNIAQGDFNHKIHPGMLCLWDTEKPCNFENLKPTSQFGIALPKDYVHHLTGGQPLQTNIIDGKTGIGAVLTQIMATATEQAADFSVNQNDTVGEVLAQMVMSCFSENIQPIYNSTKQKTLSRVYTYIDQHLSDPNLNPEKVSKAHGISVRYLHLLFSETPETFLSYLNKQRILRIQDELQNRSVSEASLTQIAFHFGFNSSAQFSRVFKRISGETPRSYRKFHTRP